MSIWVFDYYKPDFFQPWLKYETNKIILYAGQIRRSA